MNRTGLTDSDPTVEETVALPQLVNQVVEGHARIVVTRDGEPKAALVSMEDYARLKQEPKVEDANGKTQWEAWSSEVHKLREEIRADRGGKPIDLDKLIQEMKDDLEDRNGYQRGA